MQRLTLPSLLLLALPLGLGACSADDTSETGESATIGEIGETGDGDGDPAGDGDGDTSGDGDGDTTGDGDGDTSGDGDGDTAGDGDGDTTGDGDGDEPVVFALTSPAYENGGVIPNLHTCDGENISPQLDWEGAPEGTQSFAVFFTDLTFNFDHSAIWDIPAAQGGLPEAVEREPMPANVPGASQAPSYAGWHGYAGPCPPETHTYSFILYALDVPMIEELDTNASLAAARMAFEAHALAQVALDGEFTP